MVQRFYSDNNGTVCISFGTNVRSKFSVFPIKTLEVFVNTACEHFFFYLFYNEST